MKFVLHLGEIWQPYDRTLLCGKIWTLSTLLGECGIMSYICLILSLLMLTFNVLGPSQLCLTRSISWLLMPWLLASPGHQQPWYWLCRIGRSLSYSRRNFKYVLLVWRNDIKCKYMFMFSLKKVARKRLRLENSKRTGSTLPWLMMP